MTSLQSRKTTYVVAFILGALVALILASPARSAEPFRLDRIGVVRLTALGDNELRREAGVLQVDGRLTWQTGVTVPRPANTPANALGRTLVSASAWAAYGVLAPRALENFDVGDPGSFFAVGNESFAFVSPSLLAAFGSGRLVNLSTRARIESGGDEVVAGFVIEERPRMVLLRAVGPTLARFGVTGFAPDPFLTLKRNGTTLYYNDNWPAHPEANEVRVVAAQVGAFPLDEGSRDAARLVMLLPGAYTLHVEAATFSTPGGQVLLEVYSVPDEVVVTYGRSDAAKPQ